MKQKPVKKLVQELFVRLIDEQMTAPVVKIAEAPKRKYRKRRKGGAVKLGAR